MDPNPLTSVLEITNARSFLPSQTFGALVSSLVPGWGGDKGPGTPKPGTPSRGDSEGKGEIPHRRRLRGTATVPYVLLSPSGPFPHVVRGNLGQNARDTGTRSRHRDTGTIFYPYYHGGVSHRDLRTLRFTYRIPNVNMHRGTGRGRDGALRDV